MNAFTQFIFHTYQQVASQLPCAQVEALKAFREEACALLSEQQFHDIRRSHPSFYASEVKSTEPDYQLQLTPDTYRPVEEYFHCKVQDIDTQMFVFLNGWYVHDQMPLTVSPEGVIAGSLIAAIERYPELVLPYLTQHRAQQSMEALNQLLFNDGLFVYVPQNVVISKPIQLISLTNTQHNTLLQNRNLIVIGEGAEATFVQCDDSLNGQKNLINNITTIQLEKEARFSYYKMENKDAQSLLFNKVMVTQRERSSLYSNAITFNAGLLRNDLHIQLTEPFATCKLYGLYLVDRKQHVETEIFVDHQVPDCESYQLYKGIVDDEASAYFKGHVIVQPQAQRTIAYQTNRNIALTNEAHVQSQPFLEIYADNVKCNHGTTVGQLDEEAMYYLRTRGICERNARMLLMFAFANEIADKIEIISLQKRYKEMIQKRLRGELTICDRCVLHCSPKEWHFDLENK